jgi:hypothetical protein
MTTDELRRLWQERSVASGSAREGCLDEASFAALLSGDMDSKARAEAGSHIALCQDCADEFRALRSMGGLFEEKRRERSSRVPLGLALAASLLVAAGLTIALFRYRGELERSSAELERVTQRERSLVEAGQARDAEVASLRERLDSALSIHLDAPIVDLDPFDATRGGGRDPVTTVDIGEGVKLATLILNFPPRRPGEGFRVEIFDEAGELRFEGVASPRRPRREGASVNVTLSRAAAPGGVYRIRLSDGDSEIAEYRVRLRYAGEPR